MAAPLTRLDPADDILAPHSHECMACGKAILDNQQWASFCKSGMPVGRVHMACWIVKGPAVIAAEYETRIRDAAGFARPTVARIPTVLD